MFSVARLASGPSGGAWPTAGDFRRFGSTGRSTVTREVTVPSPSERSLPSAVGADVRAFAGAPRHDRRPRSVGPPAALLASRRVVDPYDVPRPRGPDAARGPRAQQT